MWRRGGRRSPRRRAVLKPLQSKGVAGHCPIPSFFSSNLARSQKPGISHWGKKEPQWQWQTNESLCSATLKFRASAGVAGRQSSVRPGKLLPITCFSANGKTSGRSTRRRGILCFVTSMGGFLGTKNSGTIHQKLWMSYRGRNPNSSSRTQPSPLAISSPPHSGQAAVACRIRSRVPRTEAQPFA